MYTIVKATPNNEKIVILFQHSTDIALALPYLYSLNVEINKIVTDVGASACGGWDELGGLIYYKDIQTIELVTADYTKRRQEFDTAS